MGRFCLSVELHWWLFCDQRGYPDKQADTDHQTATTSALRLYLIVPKTMRETTLQPQFEQYGPIKNKRRTNAVTSTNNNVVRLTFVQYSELSHAAKAFEECNPAYRPKKERLLPRLQQPGREGKPERESGGPRQITHKIHKARIRLIRNAPDFTANRIQFIPITGHRKTVTALHHL